MQEFFCFSLEILHSLNKILLQIRLTSFLITFFIHILATKFLYFFFRCFHSFFANVKPLKQNCWKFVSLSILLCCLKNRLFSVKKIRFYLHSISRQNSNPKLLTFIFLSLQTLCWIWFASSLALIFVETLNCFSLPLTFIFSEIRKLIIGF